MKIRALVTILGLAGAIAAPTSLAHAQDTLKVGMDPLYEPFSFQTPDGKLTGFDYEVSSALCEAIEVTCNIMAIPYDGSIAALQSGQIDTLINTYAMTPERKEKFTMVGPYIKPTFRFITTKNSHIDGTLATLKGKTVGMEKGGEHIHKYIKATFGEEVTVQLYDQVNEAMLDLDTGRIDAVLGDENQLYYAYAKKDPSSYKMVGERASDPKFFGEGQGFMLRKGDEKWAGKLKTALDTIIKNGKYDAISKKYFGRNILTN
ncbi:transporter substrate-binding domain-containing protein [Sinorhizobium medicae]|nr:transporter substrate-binding domain-containing protein [Sinorhizobium medicae]MDX0421097.1 transporter substrate-binding domain-containing protein [Sinorhizobium medicae]MDX1034697.1 transporter substrate-binding domain-containing protein [Sinorhizobium medicae]